MTSVRQTTKKNKSYLILNNLDCHSTNMTKYVTQVLPRSENKWDNAILSLRSVIHLVIPTLEVYLWNRKL